jgi:hypothetical protein
MKMHVQCINPVEDCQSNPTSEPAASRVGNTRARAPAALIAAQDHLGLG